MYQSAQIGQDECLLRRPKVKLFLRLVLIQAWSVADYMENAHLLGHLALSPFPQLGKGSG